MKPSDREMREAPWVTSMSPRAERELVGVLGYERLWPSLRAVVDLAVGEFGSEAALERALREDDAAIQASFSHEGERYFALVTYNREVDKPELIVVHTDEYLDCDMHEEFVPPK